ncbi:outer membrane protein assembly factor BamB family protein [Adhaeretor mobilis]|uniref:Outer membrane biogenesis protein BamB n=1 Tax=Adhaeretor mobilis TaxID=1930276 RepID=A0A517MQJ6_9BACT|nr:PQQ-binding-like beta-propeller repeat protein [Adhaeretor mobilis]QDS97144.1 outer membrane biogenesis protein BamB [Adhaeretor mobilis]
MNTRSRKIAALVIAAALGWAASFGLDFAVAKNVVADGPGKTAQGDKSQQTGDKSQQTGDWSQWGGSSARNNVPVASNIPTEWEIGDFDYETGEWDDSNAQNIKWVAKLGSQSYGNAVVSDGRIFIGTNNSGGHLKRYPSNVDLGCLLCFDLESGRFLWQHSSEKLPSGRVHDWPLQGICSASYVEGDRLWFVTSRGEVRCVDTAGFYDDENDGPFTDEESIIKEKGQEYNLKEEADIVWVFDMMKELGISQHNMCSCSVTAAGDVLFVNTSNGVDVEHNYIPAPEAPSFFAMDKKTGKVLWTDNSPGLNILHGQWSSPTYAEIDGQAQVIFGGGDGWVYSFDPAGDGEGNAKLLWRFDANPKESKWELMGKGTRNNIIATPVIYDNVVYVAVGQDPEHGEGVGHLWCIDPTKSGDVSPELAYNSDDPDQVIPHKRVQAVVPEEGDFARPNPNSAVIWHYEGHDKDGDGKLGFDETMHRSCGTVAIKDDVLYIADFSGLFHCLNAKTGEFNWNFDMLSAAWGSPLIVDDKVFIGDEDGEIAVFKHSADPTEAMKREDPDDEESELVPYFGQPYMGATVYSTPIVAHGVLYISSQSHLFAIQAEEN